MPPFVRTQLQRSSPTRSSVKSAEVKALISEIDGFKAYYLIRTGDGAVSVSVYEDQAGADESTQAAAAFIRQNLPDLGVAAPQVFSGEVVLDA